MMTHSGQEPELTSEAASKQDIGVSLEYILVLPLVLLLHDDTYRAAARAKSEAAGKQDLGVSVSIIG